MLKANRKAAEKFGIDLDLIELTKDMQNKLIIDGRRIFSQKKIPPEVRYRTIGNSVN